MHTARPASTLLRAIGPLWAISFGAMGCSSEAGFDESESAIGGREVTPFDQQYFQVSVAWPAQKMADVLHGDPKKYDYTPDCSFELSFKEEDGAWPILTVDGKPKTPSEGLAAGEGVLSRDLLTRKSLRTKLTLRCENEKARMGRDAKFELPPVAFSDTLGALQTFTMVPEVDGKVRNDLPVQLSIKVYHSRVATGLLSNCSAFSGQPKGAFERVFVSTDTRFDQFGTSAPTAFLSIDGGKLKKEMKIESESQEFVPIAYCRPKSRFGSEGVPMEFTAYQDGKPLVNTTRNGQPINSAPPMKAGEERVLRHGQGRGFETILRVY